MLLWFTHFYIAKYMYICNILTVDAYCGYSQVGSILPLTIPGHEGQLIASPSNQAIDGERVCGERQGPLCPVTSYRSVDDVIFIVGVYLY